MQEGWPGSMKFYRKENPLFKQNVGSDDLLNVEIGYRDLSEEIENKIDQLTSSHLAFSKKR